jgi:hypothetical protein
MLMTLHFCGLFLKRQERLQRPHFHPRRLGWEFYLPDGCHE